MPNIRLELHEVRIERPKKRWNLYFVLATEHPENPEQMAIAVVPGEPMRMVRTNDNLLDLSPAGEGADGMILLERPLPAKRSVRTRLWVRHSRKAARSAGEILGAMKEELGADAFDIVQGILGTESPWLLASKSAVTLIAGILRKLPDRDLGFVSMDEVFDQEFVEDGELDRAGGTGAVEAVWSWALD